MTQDATKLKVTVQRYADVIVLVVSGRVDYLNAEAFKDALMPHVAECGQGKDQLLLDLSTLEYISSAGLRVLMIAAKDARARQGHLLAVSLQPVVFEIFEISRFNLIFDIFNSVREALEKISPAALAAYDAKK